jgi:hypothetical protein
MQASRLTAIAGWLRSGTGCARRANRLAVTFCRAAVCQKLRLRIGRDVLGWLIGEQKFHHHPARRLGTIGLGLHLHPRRRRADAARGQHALAFDLDHADAAIAVGAVTGLGRIAQMRKLDAERRAARKIVSPRGCQPRVVEDEGDGLVAASSCVTCTLPIVAAQRTLVEA